MRLYERVCPLSVRVSIGGAFSQMAEYRGFQHVSPWRSHRDPGFRPRLLLCLGIFFVFISGLLFSGEYLSTVKTAQTRIIRQIVISGRRVVRQQRNR